MIQIINQAISFSEKITRKSGQHYGIRLLILIVLFICISSLPGLGINIEFSGQATGVSTLGNDPADKRSHFEEIFGYIPSLSLAQPIKPSHLIDLEASLNSTAVLDGFLGSGEGGADTDIELFRLWGRYTSTRLEFRGGLQKIAFGPGKILRPLAWFDNLNLKDPTGQTVGVGAIRGRYFAKDRWNINVWAIRPDNFDYAAPGGRIEKTFTFGDAALSYHHRPAYNKKEIPEKSGNILLPANRTENRFAFDLRMDIGIGLWTEAVYVNDPNLDRGLFMIGGDFTFDLGNGLYVMAENMADINNNLSDSNEDNYYSAIMGSYPTGISETVILIVEYDWRRKRLLKYLRYQRDYDRLSLNLILYSNPNRNELNTAIPKTLAGFGTGIRFMAIYNH